jgi:hypothetical protein
MEIRLHDIETVLTNDGKDLARAKTDEQHSLLHNDGGCVIHLARIHSGGARPSVFDYSMHEVKGPQGDFRKLDNKYVGAVTSPSSNARYSVTAVDKSWFEPLGTGTSPPANLGDQPDILHRTLSVWREMMDDDAAAEQATVTRPSVCTQVLCAIAGLIQSGVDVTPKALDFESMDTDPDDATATGNSTGVSELAPPAVKSDSDGDAEQHLSSPKSRRSKSGPPRTPHQRPTFNPSDHPLSDELVQSLTASLDGLTLSTENKDTADCDDGGPTRGDVTHNCDILVLGTSPALEGCIAAWTSDPAERIRALLPNALREGVLVDRERYRGVQGYVLNFPRQQAAHAAVEWMLEVNSEHPDPIFKFLVSRTNQVYEYRRDTRTLLLRGVYAESIKDAGEGARKAVCNFFADEFMHSVCEPDMPGDSHAPHDRPNCDRHRFNVNITFRSEKQARVAYRLLRGIVVTGLAYARRHDSTATAPVTVATHWQMVRCKCCNAVLVPEEECKCDGWVIRFENAKRKLTPEFMRMAKGSLRLDRLEHGSSLSGEGRATRKTWATGIGCGFHSNTVDATRQRCETWVERGLISNFYIARSLQDPSMRCCHSCGHRAALRGGSECVEPHVAGDGQKCPLHPDAPEHVRRLRRWDNGRPSRKSPLEKGNRARATPSDTPPKPTSTGGDDVTSAKHYFPRNPAPSCDMGATPRDVCNDETVWRPTRELTRSNTERQVGLQNGENAKVTQTSARHASSAVGDGLTRSAGVQAYSVTTQNRFEPLAVESEDAVMGDDPGLVSSPREDPDEASLDTAAHSEAGKGRARPARDERADLDPAAGEPSSQPETTLDRTPPGPGKNTEPTRDRATGSNLRPDAFAALLKLPLTGADTDSSSESSNASMAWREDDDDASSVSELGHDLGHHTITDLAACMGLNQGPADPHPDPRPSYTDAGISPIGSITSLDLAKATTPASSPEEPSPPTTPPAPVRTAPSATGRARADAENVSPNPRKKKARVRAQADESDGCAETGRSRIEVTAHTDLHDGEDCREVKPAPLTDKITEHNPDNENTSGRSTPTHDHGCVQQHKRR